LLTKYEPNDDKAYADLEMKFNNVNWKQHQRILRDGSMNWSESTTGLQVAAQARRNQM